MGKITRKHLFEIAKIKHQDAINRVYSLESMTRLVAVIAYNIGVEIVDEIDPKEYKDFLEKRQEIIQKQMEELEEKKAAKMLRTGTTPV